MRVSQSEIRSAHLAALREEFSDLARRGVWVSGNVFSPIVLVTGALDEAERAGGELLGGADGGALRAALLRLGYAPEDFCALSAVADSGALPAALFREALEALDPEAVLVLDDVAADAMREAYAEVLADIEDFETATLAPGRLAVVSGRPVEALHAFERSHSEAREKQRMWAYIKQLPPAGAPY